MGGNFLLLLARNVGVDVVTAAFIELCDPYLVVPSMAAARIDAPGITQTRIDTPSIDDAYISGSCD